MNRTATVSIYSDDSIFALFSLFTAIYTAITFYLCLVLLLPVFSIFVHVFRKNRDKEKDSKVFPILNHFFRTTIFDYLFMSLMLIHNLYLYFYPEFITKYPTFALIFAQGYDFLIVFFEIHHLIIILLAVQRFILYFELPVKADFSSKAINEILFILYFFGYFKLAIFEVSILVFKSEIMLLIYQQMLMYESLIFHVLMFASASLYIPISVSIKRKSHLVSIINHKPDRFILYQTIGLAAFKITSLRMHIYEHFEVDNPEDYLFAYGNHYDFFTTPVLIQMSFLLSNKRNLDTIRNIFKRKSRTAPSGSLGATQSVSVDT